MNIHSQKLKSMMVGTLTAFALLGAPLQASASAVAFSVTPNSIQAGEQSVLDLQLFVQAAPLAFGYTFAGGTVTLFSGTGQSQAFNWNATLGLDQPTSTTLDFSQAFTYLNPGDYLPYFTSVATATYQCHCGPNFEFVIHQDGPYTESWSSVLTVNGAQAAVPVPAALPLFASGLAGLGWLARRKKRQQATAC